MDDVGKKPEGIPLKASESSQPLEDRALKMAAQFFGKELLPLLGIPGTVKRIAPTEQIHLEMKSFMEDFNFEMKDGTWCHFEFESDSITLADLRRFRSYEAVTGHYYGVEVVTHVICTANVKIPKKKLKQGINTYRVRIIRMKGKNADEIIADIERKQKKSGLAREDLASLLLTPLMSGSLRVSERIRKSMKLIHAEREVLGRVDVLRMESVLYAFAMKFLNSEELHEIEEVFKMTELGQMLEQRGIERGLERGLAEGKLKGKLEGEKQLAVLMKKLIDDSRLEALKKATEDEAFRAQLYEEYGMKR